MPPMFQTSLFTFSDYDDMIASYRGEKVRPIYTRGLNPTVRMFEEMLARLQSAEDALGFASGMVVISSTVLNFLEAQCVFSGALATIRLADGTVLPIQTRTGITPNTNVTLGVRPEHVVVVSESGMTATVELMEPTGFGIIVHASLHSLPLKLFTLDRAMLSDGPKIQVARMKL